MEKMSDDNSLLQCYNRGCGQKFNPDNNKDDSCRHHPGAPFFHDAYKGWSCCNKKCTDFTEFLNIKGCKLSKHSDTKPPEPEKPVAQEIIESNVIEVKPLVGPTLQRPPFDLPLKTMIPEIAPSLKQQLHTIEAPLQKISISNSSEIAIGTLCKNSGCGASYQGSDSNHTTCTYHPGAPVFHEGMKYWSCCQRKTSDFNAFLNQAGCENGTHLWLKDKDEDYKRVECRWDFHQTGSFVIVTIYAKQYSPTESIVKLNPIRLSASLVFPQQHGATFDLDKELRGVIDVEASNVTMYSTKVEIKLKKAEPGSWAKLDVPRPVAPMATAEKVKKVETVRTSPLEKLAPQMDAVDLSDI